MREKTSSIADKPAHLLVRPFYALREPDTTRSGGTGVAAVMAAIEPHRLPANDSRTWAILLMPPCLKAKACYCGAFYEPA